jgi:hypothetical protein
MLLRHGVLAAAACAGSPLLALSGNRATGGNEEAGLPGHSQRNPSPKSENWQDHAAALDHLGRAEFTRAVGTSFKVFSAGSALPVWVTLLAVNDLPKIAAANAASFAVPNKASSSFTPSSSGFVLVFGGSSALPQATHLFEHQDLGRLALFTVPEGNGQQLYSAVVNRLNALIIAVPYSKGQAAQPNQQAGTAAGGVRVSAPTSSADETPSPALSGSQGARRSAVRD